MYYKYIGLIIFPNIFLFFLGFINLVYYQKKFNRILNGILWLNWGFPVSGALMVSSTRWTSCLARKDQRAPLVSTHPEIWHSVIHYAIRTCKFFFGFFLVPLIATGTSSLVWLWTSPLSACLDRSFIMLSFLGADSGGTLVTLNLGATGVTGVVGLKGMLSLELKKLKRALFLWVFPEGNNGLRGTLSTSAPLRCLLWAWTLLSDCCRKTWRKLLCLFRTKFESEKLKDTLCLYIK